MPEKISPGISLGVCRKIPVKFSGNIFIVLLFFQNFFSGKMVFRKFY